MILLRLLGRSRLRCVSGLRSILRRLSRMLLLLNAHSFHALLDTLPRLLRTASLKLAQCDAAVLVFRGHLLPFFHLWNTSTLYGVTRVCNCLIACHITNLDKGNGDESWATQSTDGLGHEPLGVRLCDDDNSLAS